MIPIGITPADMVVVDGVRQYPEPSATPVETWDEKDEKAPEVEQKARPVRNKARRPADK